MWGNLMNMRLKEAVRTLNKIQASLSIEAAMVLPIFLIGLLSVSSLCMMMSLRIKVNTALYEEAKELALRCSDGHNEALSDVRSEILQKLDLAKAEYVCVEGGRSGIDFSDSDLNDTEYVQIIVRYYCKPLFADFAGVVGIPVQQNVFFHVWSGYDNGMPIADSEYVYITSRSEVYHLSRECSHLVLSIRRVAQDDIETLRNNAGARYYPCEVCNEDVIDSEVVYITNEGNRYHDRITCSGLRRTVRAIRITEVGDRRECMRCGHR